MTSDQSHLGLLKTLSLLYVEDDADTRKQMVALLERRVARVLVATDGRQGLELFQAERPDIVATDVQMPTMSGLVLASVIRLQSPTTPVILITAFETTDYLRQAVDAGIEQYVLKPIAVDRLDVALSRAAARIGAQRALSEKLERELTEAQARERELGDYLQSSAIGLVAIDESTERIVRASRGICEMLGYSEAELLRADQRMLTHPDDLEDSLHRIADLRAGRVAIVETDRRYIRKDGTVLHARVSVTQLPAARPGEGSRRLVVIADIGERVRADALHHEDQQRQIDALEASVRAKHVLPSMLTVCMHCKNVHDEHTSWQPIAEYLATSTATLVSHGVCPDCLAKYYAEYMSQ